MNQAETYFQDLAPLSHASSVGATDEGVMLVHMARLMGHACGLMPMWCHSCLSRASPFGMTQSCRLLWHNWHACSIRRLSSRAMLGGVTHEGVAPTTMVWLISKIWLPSLSLSSYSLSLFLPSPLLTLWRLHWRFRVLPQNLSPWCEKLTPLVGILIVLGIYVVSTISILFYFEIFVWMNSCGRD
jgi:Zn-dependent protease